MNGNVGIGTTCVPDGFKLAVFGKIKAKEVEIDVTNGYGAIMYLNPIIKLPIGRINLPF